ncbi:MAG: hypothetical protein ACOYMV_01555 [Verrucomicrobiia bacterium]
MNKSHALFHLREAQEAVGKMIRRIETDPSYEFGDYTVEMGHLYHHVNTAWNGRDATEEQAKRCLQEDFDRWQRFPDESDSPAMS